MTIFNKTDKFYNAPSIRKPYIPASVLLLIAFCSACYITLHAIGYFDAELALRITENVLMPTDTELFSTKPWTLITSMFFHTSPLPFLANMMGILIFGNLTSLFFSKKVVVPLFFAGGLIGAVSIWVFKYLPLTHHLLDNAVIAGSSGGMMTLAMISSFYMPEQMIRLYGVFPLKLKFIGRTMLLFSIASIFLKYDEISNFLHLGGALGGYVFLVMLKRYRLASAPIPFFSSRKKVWQSAKVEMNITHNKPTVEHEYNEIQVNKKEYLDYLLDKISENGMESLSGSEINFLNKFGKE